MPKTLFDKIWDAHLVARRADGRELIYIDRHVLHELHAPHAFEPDQHALGTLQCHHLRRENMRELGGAASEGERPEAAHRAGVAVRHRVGRTRQHHAELRRDYVRDALLWIVDVVKLDAVLPATFAHGLEKRRA